MESKFTERHKRDACDRTDNSESRDARIAVPGITELEQMISMTTDWRKPIQTLSLACANASIDSHFVE